MISEKLLKGKPGNAEKAPLFHPLSRRFHLILLLIFGFFCTTFMRMQIAITMTCMVNSTAVSLIEDEIFYAEQLHANHTSMFQSFANNTISELESEKCEVLSEDGHHIVTDYGGSLVWNHSEQNIIFSGTFWGALVICLPAMIIVQRGSPRLTLLMAVMVYVVSSAFTPFLAEKFGYKAVFLSRAVMGLGEGVVIPSINAIISNWFPMEERSSAIALFTTGNQLAGAGGNPVAAALCASNLGWPAIFYLCAILGSSWSVLWSLTSSDQPSDCKIMTARERQYLAEKVVTRTRKAQREQRIPYRKLLTSVPFLAQLQCGIVIHIIMTFLQIYLPTYLKDVLRLGVVANGTFIAIPNTLTLVFKVIWGLVVDKLKENKTISPTAAVKISQCFANFGMGIGLLSVALFVDCTRPGTALVVFCLMYVMMSTFTSGFYTSLLSLAPRYTATLSSMSQFGNMFGRLGTPFFVGIIKHSGTESEWQTLFCLLAALSLISGVIFAVFGSGEVQDWGKENPASESSPDLEEVLAAVQRTRTESVCL